MTGMIKTAWEPPLNDHVEMFSVNDAAPGFAE